MSTRLLSLCQSIQSTWRSMKSRYKEYFQPSKSSEYPIVLGGGQYAEMDDLSLQSSDEIKKFLDKYLDLTEIYREVFAPSLVPIVMKSRGGVTVPKPDNPIERMLRNRERQRHHIPERLYAHGNYLFSNTLSQNYAYIEPKLREAINSYPFDTVVDPLVLNIQSVRRNLVLPWVITLEYRLQRWNEKHEANHTIDWWYQPPGQVEGHALIAIRLNGLYELTFDE